MRVSLEGAGLQELRPELAERDAQAARADVDIAFLGIGTAADLGRLAKTWAHVVERGAMWIVYPRGVAEVTQNDVLAAGRAHGLLDVKVVRFSDTHTALRFVAPRAKR